MISYILFIDLLFTMMLVHKIYFKPGWAVYCNIPNPFKNDDCL
jgi:hypothetical protein